MLRDKSFQKGFIIVQILAIVLFAVTAIPFANYGPEFWGKFDQIYIWILQIFFAILAVIFIVLGIRLVLIKDNKLKIPHLILSIVDFVTFLVELSFCIQVMSSI